jgi:hypothetical protein
MPGKRHTFSRASILFRPHEAGLTCRLNGGGAGYRPRVRIGYYVSRLSP